MTNNTNNTNNTAKAPRSKAPKTSNNAMVALGHMLGAALGDALKAKKASTVAAKAAKAAKDAVNDAIKKGVQDNILWPEGNKRTNVLAEAIDEALNTALKGVEITTKTRTNYLGVVKWCYQHKVLVQRWDLDAQKKKAQISAVTGKVIEIEGAGEVVPKCIKGFVAMQESQEGFEEFIAAYAAELGVKDADILMEGMWRAFKRLGWAKQDEQGEWVAKS